MKKQQLYGVSKLNAKYLSEVGPGDLLIVYAGKLDGGVVGICKVVSKPFIDKSRTWSKEYPHRVRIEVLVDCSSSPLPFSTVLGQADSGADITPYLLSRSLIEVRPADKIASFVAKQSQ